MGKVLDFPGEAEGQMVVGGFVRDEKTGRAKALREPFSLEAEQALLGAALYDNRAYTAAAEMVRPTDFWEAFHGRLWRAIGRIIGQGRLAEPVTVAAVVDIDPAFHALGGWRYLADLIDRAPPAPNAKEYAQIIRHLWGLRALMGLAETVMVDCASEREASVPEMIAKVESALIKIHEGQEGSEVMEASEVGAAIMDDLRHPEKPRQTVLTGIRKLDRLIGPLERGSLTLFAGRPGMGKSALMLSVAANIAGAVSTGREPMGVLIINAEMSERQMTTRIMSDLGFSIYGFAMPPYADLLGEEPLGYDQLEMARVAEKRLQGLNLRMVMRPGVTLGQIRLLIRRARLHYEGLGLRLGAVVADHLGLFSLDADMRAFGRNEMQTIISGQLKMMAKEFDVPMLVGAQLSRAVEGRDDKRPTLSDLRDSGALEQDADVVLGLYRDAYYAEREPEPSKDPERSIHLDRLGSRVLDVAMLKARSRKVGSAKLWTDMGRNVVRNEEPEQFTLGPGSF